jgi:hypothetical protein
MICKCSQTRATDQHLVHMVPDHCRCACELVFDKLDLGVTAQPLATISFRMPDIASVLLLCGEGVAK